MKILLKRVYDPPSPADGRRILVERLWPRGLSKQRAQIDVWAKQAAPSTKLRRWFNHEHPKWDEFKRRYFKELEERTEAVRELRAEAKRGPVTFVFASAETRRNNAAALKEYLEMESGAGAAQTD